MWDTKYERMDEEHHTAYYPHAYEGTKEVIENCLKETKPSFDSVDHFFTHWFEKWQNTFNPIIQSIPSLSLQIERIIWFEGLIFLMSVNHASHAHLYYPLESYYFKVCTPEYLHSLNRLVKKCTGIDSIRLLWIICVEELDTWCCENLHTTSIFDNIGMYSSVVWELRARLIDWIIQNKLDIKQETLFSRNTHDKAFVYSFFTRTHVNDANSYLNIHNQRTSDSPLTLQLNLGSDGDPVPTQELTLKDAIGSKHLFALKRTGMNIDSAISLFLHTHRYEPIHPLSKDFTFDSSLLSVMTSELVFHASSINDKYGQELQRRLQLVLGLTLQQIEQFFYTEKLILTTSQQSVGKERKSPWYQRLASILRVLVKAEDLPCVHGLTLSELRLYDDVYNLGQDMLQKEINNLGLDALEKEINFDNEYYCKIRSEFSLRTTIFGWDKRDQSDYFESCEHRLFHYLRYPGSVKKERIWGIWIRG